MWILIHTTYPQLTRDRALYDRRSAIRTSFDSLSDLHSPGFEIPGPAVPQAESAVRTGNGSSAVIFRQEPAYEKKATEIEREKSDREGPNEVGIDCKRNDQQRDRGNHRDERSELRGTDQLLQQFFSADFTSADLSHFDLLNAGRTNRQTR